MRVGNTTGIHGTPTVVLDTSLHGGICALFQGYRDCVFCHNSYRFAPGIPDYTVHLYPWELGALASLAYIHLSESLHLPISPGLWWL